MNNSNDWRQEIPEYVAPLKIQPDQSEIIQFTGEEGIWKDDINAKLNIYFVVLTKVGDKRKFYVNSKNTSTLGQIKAIGSLKDKFAKITRIGAGRQTKYTVLEVKGFETQTIQG